MSDIAAIVWKEWREIVGQRGIRGQTGILLSAAVFGIVLPWQFGAAWVTSPLTALIWAWVPMYFVMMVVSDAFAGERERHTLETLLATRLPDHAILFGKMAAALVYSAAITLPSILLGLITVNVLHRSDGLLLYDAMTAMAMLVFGALAAVLVATAGVLISLRAPTVRQAEQTLGGVIIVAMVIPFVLVRVLPAGWKAPLVAPEYAALRVYAALLVLVALDVLLLLVVVARFRRARLIADGVVD